MPSASKPRARRHDPAKVRAALTAQLDAVRDVARELGEPELSRPSGLPGWDVRALLTHIARQVEAVPRALAGSEERPRPARDELDLVTWARSTERIAGALDEDTRDAAARTPDPAARLDAAAEELAAVLDRAAEPARVVHIRLGTLRAADFLVTRLVELVVHADDLARATGTEVPLERQALAATVRLLADALAAAAPGGSVEVRVPPYAVVQCVEGPRHTRGTPPNVVETDPLTWLRLATGRVGWADALDSAAVTASGERADLAAHLPVLR
ncbi:sterol carrier family protein [Streptomyces sp. URMC 123]|uniref:sterol carrier family protein n=1 Tax=Streptomyces sp. URMC 123 TaxID=3423403 RepID=UPI003F1C757D